MAPHKQPKCRLLSSLSQNVYTPEYGTQLVSRALFFIYENSIFSFLPTEKHSFFVWGESESTPYAHSMTISCSIYTRVQFASMHRRVLNVQPSYRRFRGGAKILLASSAELETCTMTVQCASGHIRIQRTLERINEK